MSHLSLLSQGRVDLAEPWVRFRFSNFVALKKPFFGRSRCFGGKVTVFGLFFGTESVVAQTAVVSQRCLRNSGQKTSNLHCVNLDSDFPTLLPSQRCFSVVLGALGAK